MSPISDDRSAQSPDAPSRRRPGLLSFRLTFILVSTELLVALGVVSPGLAGEPTSSETCGECHKEIYRMWRSSAHARSMEDDFFLTALRETEERSRSVSRICLKCHAPLIDVNGDVELEKKITWEGVSCDVCHSLTDVDMSGLGPRLLLDVGDVKRGPIVEATPISHDVAYSEMHTTSLACAPCHEFVNSEGTPIMTTYSEWKQSGAAERNENCQSCHMGSTKGDVVDPKFARVAETEINIHEVPGGHSLEQLHKALGIAMTTERGDGNLRVDLRVKNKGAGHAVPTGMPGRRVILDVAVRTSDGETFGAKRVYEKTFADAAGARITRASGFFTKGVSLLSDTRIQPDERRVETFSFPVPADVTAYMTVKLHYEHTPGGPDEPGQRLTFYSDRRTLVPEDR